MTQEFKTYEGKSKHRVEGVNPYISANWITCGCYGVYATEVEMKWMSGSPSFTPEMQSISMNTEVYDELLDWAFGDNEERFFVRKYTIQHMIGDMDSVCYAARLENGAIAISDEYDFSKKKDRFYEKFYGGPSTLVIFPDDLANAIAACHDEVIGVAAYSEAWLEMPLEVRKRHLSKDQTEEDTKLWQEVWSKAYWKGEAKKKANRERWKVQT